MLVTASGVQALLFATVSELEGLFSAFSFERVSISTWLTHLTQVSSVLPLMLNKMAD